MKINKVLVLWITLVLPAIKTTFGQSHVEMLPHTIEKNGRYALLVDGKPYFILGGQAHNSSGWPAMLPGVCSAVKQMRLNT